MALFTVTAPVNAAAPAQLPDFTRVVEAASPAVVNISTTQKAKPQPQGKNMPHGGRIPGIPEGTPFDELFRRFFEEGPGSEPDDGRSLGSGFIISKDGYILTNNHVVSEADEIIVRLSDRRELEAKLIGSDKRSDVALLKVNATDLPVVKIGDSKKLKVGEWVLAIGSPFDFDHTVTAGIVSALGRNLPNENYVPFIQTDVAINPGNSGGPLFNLDGEVVGINSQIYSRTGGFMGLSFTIPVDLAMDVVDQLKNGGHVSRGWLGVLIQDVTRELAQSFGMDKPEGALVSQVLPESPAEKAKLKVGDIIIEFNGRNVPTSAALPPMVGVTPINKPVKVKVLREGKMQTLMVTIGELPAEEELASAEGEAKGSGVEESRIKLQIDNLTAEQRKELGLPEKQGVLVTQVKEGPARAAGIREGDVVMMINNVKVGDTKQFRDVVAALPAGKPVAVLLQRRDGAVFLALKMPEK
jgi:serine protease Do